MEICVSDVEEASTLSRGGASAFGDGAGWAGDEGVGTVSIFMAPGSRAESVVVEDDVCVAAGVSRAWGVEDRGDETRRGSSSRESSTGAAAFSLLFFAGAFPFPFGTAPSSLPGTRATPPTTDFLPRPRFLG